MVYHYTMLPAILPLDRSEFSTRFPPVNTAWLTGGYRIFSFYSWCTVCTVSGLCI